MIVGSGLLVMKLNVLAGSSVSPVECFTRPRELTTIKMERIFTEEK